MIISFSASRIEKDVRAVAPDKVNFPTADPPPKWEGRDDEDAAEAVIRSAATTRSVPLIAELAEDELQTTTLAQASRQSQVLNESGKYLKAITPSPGIILDLVQKFLKRISESASTLFTGVGFEAGPLSHKQRRRKLYNPTNLEQLKEAKSERQGGRLGRFCTNSIPSQYNSLQPYLAFRRRLVKHLIGMSFNTNCNKFSQKPGASSNQKASQSSIMKKLCLEAMKLSMTNHPVQIRGLDNKNADAQSRLEKAGNYQIINNYSTAALQQLDHTLQKDMFATRKNAECEIDYYPTQEDTAAGTGILQAIWQNKLIFLYSRQTLIGQGVQKLRVVSCCTAVVIAMDRPSQ
ncbi:MAG: hypothetical protein EZS28_022321 [Streblomastix strix]|uniref:Uncharacterized protein n=1 Tax=Streblomastix strix TaxID=222440 RepID=A0A5J4VHT0_9EUKA|nr:MAG: hypothetical protein EZS28_022321 [Streblomastix strix]